MRIVDIRETTAKLESSMRNAVIDFSRMTTSVVAIVTDVIRDGKPVIGYGCGSNGRYAQGGILRERLIPRIMEADPETLLDPERENLDTLAKSGATLAIHLGVSHIHKIVEELKPHYGENCPVAVCYRTGWPDQDHVTGTLSDIVPKVRKKKFTRTTLILVGWVLDPANFDDSFLYNEEKAHIYRPKFKTSTNRKVKRP